jgi:D-3-phosphoglycerate dehydrogenase
MRIAVLDDYADTFRALPGAARLHAHEVVVFHDAEQDVERLASRLADVEVLLLTQARRTLPRALIERLPRLRLVAQTGRATGHIDVAACSERGVRVVSAGTGSPHAPIELTWALILASRRHLVHEARALREGRWLSTLGEGLHGQVLGVWGLGRIGRGVADVGRAFGMRVRVHGREASARGAAEAGFEFVAERARLFADSDVLSVHLPLGPDTRGLIGDAELSLMKPSALFVNTSRAGLVAPGALVRALDRGRPGSAAVDVYDQEPAVDDPLVAHPRAVCTPHLGYVERATLEAYYGAAIDTILAFAAESA